MFIVNLSYIKPLDTVDRHLPEHKEFLREQYAKGVFIVSGRKVPRTGGVILARGKSRKELLAILEADPFFRDGIADYEVTQFTPSLVAEGLDPLRE
ncbi:MAG: YciI family protein [Deltaproteobacteria bacterium]|nr:YciI family protein [Deltaproteobacteria bacterium]